VKQLDNRKVFELIDENEIVELTLKLVKIPTENPPGNYGEISKVIKAEMENAGLTTRVAEGQPGKINVFGLKQGQSDDFTLLLSGHMDVISAGDPAAWKFPPFEAKVHDGRIWGRGTVDMKGAIAAQIVAAKAVLKSGIPLKHNLLIGATVDDEIAGPMGQKYMLEKGLDEIGFPKPSFHILGEATHLDMMVAFKGRIWWELAVKGKAAHGGEPFNGINAIEKTLSFYNRLKPLLTKNHPLVGPTTLNFGTIQGGVKCNVVPEDCISTYDLRMTPQETADEWVDKVKTILENMKEEDSDFNYTKFNVFENRRPLEVDSSRSEIKKLWNIIEKITGNTPKFRGTLSAGDLYHSLMNNIPGTWIGPGDPKLLHQTNENIEIEQLILASKIYAQSILELCAV
jgi:succinyl-diaminopimelate desuccinylase